MGRVIIHAGLPKSGSTSIQRWLASHSAQLRESSGIECAVVTRNRTGPAEEPLHVSAHSNEDMNSTELVKWLAATAADPGDRDDRAIGVFREIASLGGGADVVVSSEGFWRLTARPFPAFVEALRAISSAQPVLLVMYLRPQNEYLEASWRQWGFRTDMSPSRYMARQEKRADYERWIVGISKAVPDLTVVARPVVPGGLVGGDVVGDFASHVLRVPYAVDPDATDRHNAGLPLHVVNLLSAAPRGRYFSGPHDNSALDRIKQLDFDWPESPEGAVEESRLTLRLWCMDRYGEGNRRLAASQGWDVTDLVEPVEGSARPSLGRLDRLWSPDPDVDLDATWARLDDALARRPRPRLFGPRRSG